MSGSRKLQEVLSNIKVSCDGVEYGFATVNQEARDSYQNVICTFKEDEGLTIIAPIKDLQGLAFEGPMAKLTIQAHTSLELVGLTSVIATKLAKNKISANVVAAYYHDHIFVQYDKKGEAMDILASLSE